MFFKRLRADIDAAKANDPAARSKFEIWLTYSGVHALSAHRVANFFYRIKLKLLARMISQWSKFCTGIEIHPAAKIAPGVFIDHGEGVVIGETAEIAEGCVLYQGVTLGGTGKETGKRHPTLEKNVMVSAGAKILGSITVHEGAKVGAGAVVLKDVPAHATVVGVPARVVRINGSKEDVDLYQDTGDPYLTEICSLRSRVIELENAFEEATGKKFVPKPHTELGERLQAEWQSEQEKETAEITQTDETVTDQTEVATDAVATSEREAVTDQADGDGVTIDGATTVTDEKEEE